MKKVIGCILILSAFASISYGQDNEIIESFQSYIDRAQFGVNTLDGVRDTLFMPYHHNDSLNRISNYAANVQVDNLQSYIGQQRWTNNTKLKYLRGLKDILDSYQNYFMAKRLTGVQLTTLVSAFKQAMLLDNQNQSISPILEENNYAIDDILSEAFAFKNNVGKNDFAAILQRKYIAESPVFSLSLINNMMQNNKNLSGINIDNILNKVARDSADAVYTYAQSYTPIGEYIRKSQDPLIQAISRIANAQAADGSKAGRQYMPFLDELYKGKLTMDQVDSAMSDNVSYFKLLVKTEIDYTTWESENHDTVLAKNIIKVKLQDVATDDFINVVNGLHEKPNNERYACLQSLSPTELYYLVVTTEDIIYTSTYVNGKDYGIYNLIWQKGGKKLTGEKLMMAVHFDYAKKWIKMAANYNTLDNFLGRMQPANAQQLMRYFVRNLDAKTGADELEDAVDVAGTYVSIDNPDIKQLVLDEVQSNLAKARRTHNRKAYNIYDILNTLFLSTDSTKNIDVSQALGIPPVYYMPIDELKDASGKIIIHQITYGDLDGRTNYDNFMNAFSGAGWKQSSNKYWSTVSSTKGVPIVIYTNKPLDEKRHLDDDAQDSLNYYLSANDLHPTLLFHRGHSYYLNSSIKQLQPSERVVFLGSCGGFQSLNKVLQIAPNAQIISTKQTGVGDLNLGMIQGIINTLQRGKNLNWVSMWKGFDNKLSKDTRFADYVPPYQNLGAVFLMAYQRLEDKEN